MRKILVDFSSSGNIHRIFAWSPRMQKLNFEKHQLIRQGSYFGIGYRCLLAPSFQELTCWFSILIDKLCSILINNCSSSVNDATFMLTSRNLQKKSSEVLFKGQATKQTTVKWSIEDITQLMCLSFVHSITIKTRMGPTTDSSLSV